MPDQDGYPTDDELQKLKEWDGIADPMGLVSFLEEIWHWPDWGIKTYFGYETFPKHKKVLRFQLHCGGWSGNEEIIRIIQSSNFWFLYWVRSDRGGHYYFTIPLLKKK